MDWSKAKTILIIALIITILFLIVTYGFQDEEDGEDFDAQLLIKALADKNIYLEVGIPEKHGDMSVLEVEYQQADSAAVEDNLTTVVRGREDGDLQAAADDFLERIGMMSEYVAYDKVIRNEDKAVVIYKNVWKGVTIEESYLYCVFDCSSEYSELMGFQQYWLNPVRETNKKIGVYSAAESLIVFMSQVSGEEPVSIENMELIYWLDDSGFDAEQAVSDTAFPAWKITYNNGKIMRINASER